MAGSGSDHLLYSTYDPEALIDGRKNPAKAEQRKQAMKKAAETRMKKMRQEAAPIPGGFPVDTPPWDDTPTLEEELGELASLTPIPQRVLSLAFGTVDPNYEGPYAVVQPKQIEQEAHAPVKGDQAQEVATRTQLTSLESIVDLARAAVAVLSSVLKVYVAS